MFSGVIKRDLWQRVNGLNCATDLFQAVFLVKAIFSLTFN